MQIPAIFARLRLLAFSLALTLAPSSINPAYAQGDLLVAPTRVILDGRRGTEVILSNIGAKEATYRVSLELRRMGQDGSLSEIAQGAASERELSALEMIRYAPRRVTLPPGQPQAVRIAARPGADLPDGEYRAHMSFRAIPAARPVTEEDPSATGVSIRLIPIYGVTIPIIIRHGHVQAVASLSDPAIREGASGPELHVSIRREGTGSTYGSFRALKPGAGEPIVEVNGIAAYSELSRRDVVLALRPEQAAELRGPVRLEYREMPEAGGGLIAAMDATF